MNEPSKVYCVKPEGRINPLRHKGLIIMKLHNCIGWISKVHYSVEQEHGQRLYHVEAQQKWRIKRYLAFQIGNNKGADQTGRMRRLVSAFVVHEQ